MKPAKIRAALRHLAVSRVYPSTFCPSEVARGLGEKWRPLMPAIRDEAGKLLAEGELECLQRGRVVALGSAKGPVRFRRPLHARPDSIVSD